MLGIGHYFRELEGRDDNTGTGPGGWGIDPDALAIRPKELADDGIEKRQKIMTILLPLPAPFNCPVVRRAIFERDARNSGGRRGARGASNRRQRGGGRA
jgi:hypothetical protein